jgi:hypothetical protein
MDSLTIAGTATVVEAKHSYSTDSGKYRVGVILEAETAKNKHTRMRGAMFSEHEVSVAVGDRVEFTASVNQMEMKYGPVLGLKSVALVPVSSADAQEAVGEPAMAIVEHDHGGCQCIWPCPKEAVIVHPSAGKYPEGSAMRGALNRAAVKTATTGDEAPF